MAETEQKSFLDNPGLSHLWAGIKAKLGGTRTVRKTIGTSTAGWTAKDCDYLCDGTADDVEIKAAINALGAGGGEIVLLDGTYNIASKISISKAYVTLKGNGKSTKLVRGFDDGPIVEIPEAGSNCTITGLYIDGKKATYKSNNNISIEVGGNNNAIIDNEVVDSYHCGIRSQGSDNTISGNTVTGNAYYGIFVRYGERNVISANIVSNNDLGIANYGCNGAIVSDNVCNGNTYYGIEFNGGDNCTVTGNTCNGNNRGIYLSFGNNNAIAGNTCTGNTEEGILLYDDNNAAVGNTCSGNKIGISITYTERITVVGNHCVLNTNCNLHLIDATHCLISNNNLTVLSNDDTKPTYALWLEGKSNNNNIITENMTGNGNISNGGGTGNIMGYATEDHNHDAAEINSGTLPIARGGTGATTVSDILDNLGMPTSENYTPRRNSNNTSSSYFNCDAIVDKGIAYVLVELTMGSRASNTYAEYAVASGFPIPKYGYAVSSYLVHESGLSHPFYIDENGTMTVYTKSENIASKTIFAMFIYSVDEL